jgi:hypothetical protein
MQLAILLAPRATSERNWHWPFLFFCSLRILVVAAWLVVKKLASHAMPRACGWIGAERDGLITDRASPGLRCRAQPLTLEYWYLIRSFHLNLFK